MVKLNVVVRNSRSIMRNMELCCKVWIRKWLIFWCWGRILLKLKWRVEENCVWLLSWIMCWWICCLKCCSRKFMSWKGWWCNMCRIWSLKKWCKFVISCISCVSCLLWYCNRIVKKIDDKWKIVWCVMFIRFIFFL